MFSHIISVCAFFGMSGMVCWIDFGHLQYDDDRCDPNAYMYHQERYYCVAILYFPVDKNRRVIFCLFLLSIHFRFDCANANIRCALACASFRSLQMSPNKNGYFIVCIWINAIGCRIEWIFQLLLLLSIGNVESTD